MQFCNTKHCKLAIFKKIQYTIGMIQDEITSHILDSISDGVFTIDKDFSISSFNRAAEKITGVKKEEALGQKCFEVFRSNMCEKICPLRKTLKTGKKQIDIKGYCISKEGRKIPISVSTALLKDKRGRILGGAETFRDLSEIENLKKELKRASLGKLESKNASMQKIQDMLPSLAESLLPVLIQGETGTGKEIVAKSLHQLSPLKDGPFVAINCSAFPESLLESELFGYKKGAFTGADKDKPGRFALAENGTLFLDEIGDISLNLQVKLLRVLQEGEYEVIGGRSPIKTNARIISATNRKLEELIEAKKFRMDFYYRINVIGLELPPLKERTEDIVDFAELFLDGAFFRKNPTSDENPYFFSAEVLRYFYNYPWPGNIRELENTVERMLALARSYELDKKLLPESFFQEKKKHEGKQGDDLTSIKKIQEKAEKKMLIKCLEKNNWHKGKTASDLEIDTSTLWRKLKKYGIERATI